MKPTKKYSYGAIVKEENIFLDFGSKILAAVVAVLLVSLFAQHTDGWSESV